MRWHVMAVRHPRGHVVFGICWAHFFGDAPAVTNFYRYPSLVVAVARRALALPTWNFFDDLGVLRLGAQRAQSALVRLLELFGIPAKASKHLEASTFQLHLGVINDFSQVPVEEVALLPKVGRIAKIKSKIVASISQKKLEEGQVNELRGDINFLQCSSWHRASRVCGPALKKAQAGESNGWSPTTHVALLLLSLIHI